MSANREAMMRLRAEWKAKGLCTRCGGEKPCLFCRYKRGQYRVDSTGQRPRLKASGAV